MTRPADHQSLGSLVLALGAILVWSACFVAIKASNGSAPPASFAALRALLAGITLLPLAAATGKLAPPRDAWWWIVALGLANTTLGLLTMFLSVGLAGAALPGLLANSQALMVAPFAALLFREPLGVRRFAALIAGVAGVGFVLVGTAGSMGTLSGAALGLASAAGLATANLITKHVGAWVDALTATTWQYLIGGVPLVVWSLIVDDWGTISWNVGFIAALLFLGVVGSAVASYVWYRLVQRSELIRLNALTLLIPFFAVVLALTLYGEPFTRGTATGAVLILAAVAGVTWSHTPRPDEIDGHD